MSEFLDILNNKDVKVDFVPKTYVAIVLDKSGSMYSLKNEIIGGLNSELETIKNKTENQDVKVSLVPFSSKVENPIFWNLDIKNVRKLKDKDYKTEGMTALYDAIGFTVSKLKKQEDINDENVSVLMLVVTDGFENHSREFDFDNITKIINDLKATDRWTFSYLGTSDLTEIQKLGFDIGNTRNLDATPEGMKTASVYTSCAYDNYFSSRKIGIKSVKDFYTSSVYSEKEEEHK
jgi:hypothetical protein